MSRKLVMRVSSLVDRHTSRRGFLRSVVMSATAIAFAPAYLIRPIAAEAAIITCLGLRCSSGSACCDGWTEFCCRLTGENTCPPGTVVGGWWKVNNSSFCSYDKPRPRYYIDCNVACLPTRRCWPGGLCARSATAAWCRCPDGCDTRKVDCVQFRYGQCNQDTCVGPIRCRVVTCVPPWQWDPACSRWPALTSEATRHHDRPCLHDWFNDVPPDAFYAGAVRWMSDRGIAAGLTNDLFGPDEPMLWRHFATLLWSYAVGAAKGAPSPLDDPNPRTDYEKARDWMAQHGIAPGRTVRYVGPAGRITRAEAIVLLHRLAAVSNTRSLGEPTPDDLYPERELITERPPFPDVADGAWYGDALDWAARRGIVWWSPPEPFHPDRFVTRSEAAVYLHRFHDPSTPTPTSQPEPSQPWL
ncbi:MAG: S-layer homology domain-containing protein [bacterium]|nr:S-layer homology domain-containing protein [bacterium]